MRTCSSAGRIAAVIGSLLIALLVSPASAEASAEDQLLASELAERYAPIVKIQPQDGECDSNGERFEPAPVEIVLDNPEVFLRQVGNDDPVAMRGPGGSDLFDLREGWYLDFPGDALDPGCVFEQDFNRFFDGQSVVYAHVAGQADRPDQLVLQYWFFWYHNPAKNDHEGDWETIQLIFDAATVADALTTTPTSVGYAQHIGGERAPWDDPRLEREGDRPVVYPARGSHASYFDESLYLGRSGAEGFGCDDTTGSSRRLDPEIVLLPDEVTERDDDFAWLTFLGRWGQREVGFLNGPTGPADKDSWDEPVTWIEGLRDSSVKIAGDGGSPAVSAFCRSVDVGSTVLVKGLRSPGILLAAVALFVWSLFAAARRTTWTRSPLRPLVMVRAAGQILRSASTAWRRRPVTTFLIGSIYLPMALVASLLRVAVGHLPFVDELLELAGNRSAVSFFVTIVLGGLGNLVPFVIVSASVARLLDDDTRDETTSAVDRLPVLGLSLAEVFIILRATARATIIVVALLVSVVGIPWAIHRLVKFQLGPQVIALEGAEPAAALRRSGALVSRRWWWVTGVIALIQIALGVLGFGVSLVVLLAVPSLPLWLFNLLSSFVFVLLVPLGAAAMAYLYGALVAGERDEAIARADTDDAQMPEAAPAGSESTGAMTVSP